MSSVRYSSTQGHGPHAKGRWLNARNILIVLLLATAAVIMAGLILVMQQSSQRAQELHDMETQRGYCESAINDFMDASDYLTSEVRYYALDGDIEHLNDYWTEVETTRSRDIAIQKLLHSDLTVQETSHMLRAKAISDNIINSETWAMRMLAESHGTDEDDIPARVRAYTLIDSDEALSAEEKQTAALNYLFGSTYETNKQAVRDAVQTFRDDLATRLEYSTAASLASSKNAGSLATVGIAVLMALMVSMMIIYQHLTVKKNRQLSEALRQATAASAAKSIFTSRMSHEIRTPLNAVTGFLAIASQEEDVAKKDADIRKAQVASNNLLHIVNDVLDLSAIENGRMKLSSDTFSIAKLLDGLKLIYASQAAMKHIMLDIVVNDLPHDAVKGDRMRENQVLTNLLSNAIKFTPDGGRIELSVTQSPLEPSDGRERTPEPSSDHGHTTESSGERERVLTVFSVSDTGIGMSSDFLGKVFEPYEQADASISQKYGGTGLGLSIVKNMVEMMGGTVEVTSVEGKGSTFTVSFPNTVSTAAEKPVEHVGEQLSDA